MRKRHVVVGLAMLAASVVSYELVLSRTPQPAVDVVEAMGAGVTAKTVAPPALVQPGDPVVLSVFDSISDTAVLLATGATLLAIAAGVRRRAS